MKSSEAHRKAEFDLRSELKECIEALTYFAQILPEGDLMQVYTRETLEPLVKGLMRPEISRKDYEHYSETNLVKNRRVFELACVFLKWSLNIIRSQSNNKWFSKLYSEHEERLRELVYSYYHDVFKEDLAKPIEKS